MRGIRAVVVGIAGILVGAGLGAVGVPPVASASPTAPTAPPASIAGPAGTLVVAQADLDWASCPAVPPGPPEEPPPPALPMECATLAVPLDHDQPGGRQVALALYRLPGTASDPTTRLGSLVMNPGGPGVPTRDFLAAVAAGVPPPVAARYDLVTFDPRGVGASEGLICGGPDLLIEAVGDPFADQLAFGQGLGVECLAEDAALVGRMTSTDIARDLDLVRAALGDERLTYLGFSWGTLLGGLYAELHPARVGRMVLDGAIDPNLGYLDELRRSALGVEAVLASFFAFCDADPDCALQPYGTGDVWRWLAWRASEGDLVAPDGRRLDLNGFFAAAYAALGTGRPAFPGYARALLEAAQGDPTFLVEVAEAYASVAPAGAFFAIRCGDSTERPSRDEVQLAAAELIDEAPNFYPGMVEILGCAGLPPSATVRPAVAVAAGEVAPVLVVGNTADPATPYEAAVALTGALGGSRLLTFDGEGHTIAFQGVPCIDDAVAAYLLGGSLPAEGTVCGPPSDQPPEA